jgi:hypothetical protein
MKMKLEQDHLLSFISVIRVFQNVKRFPLAKTPLTFLAEDEPDTAQDELIETINTSVVESEFSTLSATQFQVPKLVEYYDCKRGVENSSLLCSYLRIQNRGFQICFK